MAKILVSVLNSDRIPKIPVLIGLWCLVTVIGIAITGRSWIYCHTTLAAAELPPPTESHEPLVEQPKEDLRVKMLYDTNMATPYITSYSTAGGGLSTMQLSLLSKNAGKTVAPNGLYVICWKMNGNRSGAIIIDPISGDVITTSPLQTSFTMMFGQKPAPRTMPEEMPPVPPPVSPGPPIPTPRLLPPTRP